MLQKSPMYAYIPVKDISRARNFYEQKLGFKPSREAAGGIARGARGRRHVSIGKIASSADKFQDLLDQP
jgi:extradiol dioxygenase family protein